jgi:dolichol-phosphate hexosyltransferase
MKKITVVIPCYNEEDGIAAVISGFPRAKLAAQGYKLHILVIDNNSTDKTAEVARAAGAEVVYEPKKGKGHAIRTGFYSIPDGTDYVVMLDGDDTYKPQEILRLIEPLDSGFAKVIIGSRMHGRIRVGSMKALNRMGNRVYSRAVRTTYKVTVTDVLTGYFAWSKEVIETLRPHLKSAGFAIEMEMITKMARLGYEIYSVPVSYDPRLGESNLNPVRDGARIMKMYVQNLRWKPESRRPVGARTGRPAGAFRRPAFFESIRPKDM